MALVQLYAYGASDTWLMIPSGTNTIPFHESLHESKHDALGDHTNTVKSTHIHPEAMPYNVADYNYSYWVTGDSIGNMQKEDILDTNT